MSAYDHPDLYGWVNDVTMRRLAENPERVIGALIILDRLSVFTAYLARRHTDASSSSPVPWEALEREWGEGADTAVNALLLRLSRLVPEDRFDDWFGGNESGDWPPGAAT